MIDELEAQLFGDPALKPFDVLVAEFDDASGLDIDQVIVVRLRSLFVTRAAVAKIMALQNAGILEQLYRSINCGDGDVRIDGRRAPVELFSIRMVGGLRQHTGDHPALFGHPQSFLDAEILDPCHARLRSGLVMGSILASLGPFPKGWQRQIAAQNQGIFAFVRPGIVISRPSADSAKAKSGVKACRASIANGDFKEDVSRAQSAGVIRCGTNERCAHAAAPSVRPDCQRQYLRLVCGNTGQNKAVLDTESERTR